MNDKRLLQDLTDELAALGKLKKKDADEFLRAFFKVTEESLFEGEVVRIPSLGSFKLILVEARKSVNVSTGEEMEIQEHFKLSFIPDSSLKDAVNEPFSHLEPVEIDLPANRNEFRNAKKGTEAKPSEKEESVLKNRYIPDEELYETQEDPLVFPEKKETYERRKKRRRRNRKGKYQWLWWVLFFVILIGFGLWTWLSNQAALKEYQRKILLIEGIYQAENDSLLMEESAALQTADSLEVDSAAVPDSGKVTATKPASATQSVPASEVKPVAATTKPAMETKTPAKTTAGSPGRHELPAIVTIRDGSRLTLMAQKYYGNKAFWVYIYQANESEISDPNNIPTGTQILIPEPDPGLIDPNNPDLIRKARVLAQKILGQ